MDTKTPPNARGPLAPPALKTALAWLAGASIVLVVSALPIDESTVPEAETIVFGWINGLPGAAYVVVWPIMQLGNVVAVPAAAIAAALWRRLWLSIALLVSGIGTWLLAKVVKVVVTRGRPAELLEDVIRRGAPAGGRGYVSGHAAVVAAIATLVTPYLPPRLRIVAWALAALAGLARVYVGAHLPLDIVGGAALGVMLGALPWIARAVATRRASS